MGDDRRFDHERVGHLERENRHGRRRSGSLSIVSLAEMAWRTSFVRIEIERVDDTHRLRAQERERDHRADAMEREGAQDHPELVHEFACLFALRFGRGLRYAGCIL
jgi:hypothetical protein